MNYEKWPDSQLPSSITRRTMRQVLDNEAQASNKDALFTRPGSIARYAGKDKPLLNLINENVDLQGMEADWLSVAGNHRLLLIHLINTNVLLPYLSGVHITLIKNNINDTHFTINLPAGWRDIINIPGITYVRLAFSLKHNQQIEWRLNYQDNRVNKQFGAWTNTIDRIAEDIFEIFVMGNKGREQIYPEVQIHKMLVIIKNILENTIKLFNPKSMQQEIKSLLQRGGKKNKTKKNKKKKTKRIIKRKKYKTKNKSYKR